MRWVWPFNWYWELRELREQLANKRRRVAELEKELSEQQLATAFVHQHYAAVLVGLSSTLDSLRDPSHLAK